LEEEADARFCPDCGAPLGKIKGMAHSKSNVFEQEAERQRQAQPGSPHSLHSVGEPAVSRNRREPAAAKSVPASPAPARSGRYAWKKQLAITMLIISVLGGCNMAVDGSKLRDAKTLLQRRIDSYPGVAEVPTYLLQQVEHLEQQEKLDNWSLGFFVVLFLGSLALFRKSSGNK
jgi:hypothetical protein